MALGSLYRCEDCGRGQSKQGGLFSTTTQFDYGTEIKGGGVMDIFPYLFNIQLGKGIALDVVEFYAHTKSISKKMENIEILEKHRWARGIAQYYLFVDSYRMKRLKVIRPQRGIEAFALRSPDEASTQSYQEGEANRPRKPWPVSFRRSQFQVPSFDLLRKATEKVFSTWEKVPMERSLASQRVGRSLSFDGTYKLAGYIRDDETETGKYLRLHCMLNLVTAPLRLYNYGNGSGW